MSIIYASARSQKILICVSLILGLGYAVGFAFLCDFWPAAPPPTLNTAQVVALYAHANLKFRIGVVLMLATGAFYIPWSTVIAIQMARDEKGVPIWALIEGLMGPMQAIILVLPALFWGVAAFTIGRNPALTELMNELGWLSFITPSAFFPFQTIPLTVVALSRYKQVDTSAFPRWLGWLSLWVGISASLGALAQVFKTGIFAWNGLFPFYLPVVLFASWIGCVTYCLWRAIGLQEGHQAT